MRPRLISLFPLIALAFSSFARADEAKINRFEKDIQAYEAADKATPPPQGAILFTGASSIRGWKSLAADFPGLTVINRGFGGSTVADAVHFADRIVIPYRPKIIVLQAGGNDINGGRTPAQVLTELKAFVEKVRAKLPDVKIIYLGINPSPARWAQRDKQQEVNTLAREFLATQKNTIFAGLWAELIGADGLPRPELYVADRLHPSAEGYQQRAKALRPLLE
jgi:lysophospholipase L1-like esterase